MLGGRSNRVCLDSMTISGMLAGHDESGGQLVHDVRRWAHW